MIDDVFAREKQLKGPADYPDNRKYKIPGTYTTNTETGQLMNETEYLAKQSPGSNQYKPNFDRLSQAKRVPRADMNRDKSAKNPMVPLKKDNSPSPVTYKDVDKNWKKMSTYRNSCYNYSIRKEPKKSFIDIA